MARVVVRRGAARREQLLDGLVAIFLAEGFSALGLDDLAARLQCSKSTLYAVAPSKEQLIAAVVRAFFRGATQRVEARLAAETDPVARIRAYLDAIAAELAPASPAFLADVQAFAPTRGIYADNTAAAARRVEDLVTAAAGPGRAGHGVDARFLAAVAAEVMPAVQQGRLLGGHDHAAAYSALADLVVAGLAGAPGRSSADGG